MPKHGVRFAPGTVVSPGEYRNVETGQVRYFDGSTPLPGKVNAASWQQISDHYHPGAAGAHARHHMPDQVTRGVRFASGVLVSPGEYRNEETGQIRYFDGNTPLPGKGSASSWQQVSDHHHPGEGGGRTRHHMPDQVSARSGGVRFAPGTVVSPGEYRNVETGHVRYFDGNTPLPGKANAASWQQISDHYHAESEHQG
jgi:hypothetical protein